MRHFPHGRWFLLLQPLVLAAPEKIRGRLPQELQYGTPSRKHRPKSRVDI